MRPPPPLEPAAVLSAAAPGTSPSMMASSCDPTTCRRRAMHDARAAPGIACLSLLPGLVSPCLRRSAREMATFALTGCHPVAAMTHLDDFLVVRGDEVVVAAGDRHVHMTPRGVFAPLRHVAWNHKSTSLSARHAHAVLQVMGLMH